MKCTAPIAYNRALDWRGSPLAGYAPTKVGTMVTQAAAAAVNGMAPRRFDLVVFDWDGTLFDSTAIIARSIQAAVKDVSGEEPSFEQASHVIGLGLLHALRFAAPHVGPEQYPELARRYSQHYDAHADDLSLFPGVLDMLADLKARGYQLAVATGKSRRGLDKTLAMLPMEGVFHATRTADETAGKPDPCMLHELMEQLTVDPTRTLMVGDTSHDLQMANNAGCTGVGVSYGAHPLAQLQALNPLFIASSAQALHRGLLQHSQGT